MTEMTIHETTAAFINHLRENGKKERTLYTYRKDLDLIEGYFGKDKKLLKARMPGLCTDCHDSTDATFKKKHGNLVPKDTAEVEPPAPVGSAGTSAGTSAPP